MNLDMETKDNKTVKDSNDFYTLLGTVLSKKVTLSVKILRIDNEVPTISIDDFKEWLFNKGKECGIGVHHEYYPLSEKYEKDIGVYFEVHCG